MKRFHVHIAVDDLAANIAFYSKLFGQVPYKVETDYAKWMLEDPRINFAISARGHVIGVNHFGMQVDSAEELSALRVRADTASGDMTLDQGRVGCCYAESEKHWTVDPQGMAWEHFYTVRDSASYGEDMTSEQVALHAPRGAIKQPDCCPPLRGSIPHTSCCD